LSEAEAASLVNPDDLLSYEQQRDVRDALTSARGRQDKLCGAQHKLDDARRRLDDPDNPPPTVDDIEDIEDDIEKVMADVAASENVLPTFDSAASSPDNLAIGDLDIKIDMYVP